MKKKRLIKVFSIVILVLAVLGVAAGISITNVKKQLQAEEELKEKNSKSSITEVFHDPANEYISPEEPTTEDDITLRLRTERYNVTKAQIQYTVDKGVTWQTADMSFEKHDDTGYYDFFVGTIPAQENTIYYRFLCGNEVSGVTVDRNLKPDSTGDYKNGWCIMPGYSVPDWSKGALWYNINPDAFYNGDASNDVTTSDASQVNAWNNLRYQLSDRYGGDLAGIAAKVDHIKDLYVDSVFLNPFYKGYQNGGYNPTYLNQVDSTFGNAQELQKLTEIYHNAGLKIGSDSVMTFTNNDSIYFDQRGRHPLLGAAESKESDFYDLIVYYEWPNNWHSTWGQPAVDHNRQSVQDLMYATPESFMQYYTSAPFNLDSWRFDCGGWLYGIKEDGYMNSQEVIANVSRYMKAINPDVLLSSENCGYDQLLSGDWDSHWNIYFMKQMQNYVGGLINESQMTSMLKNTLDCYPRPMALSIYNLNCNHDEPRTGDVPAYMEAAQILTMMNYIGSPSIYYGEEMNLYIEKQSGMGGTQSFYAMDWDESNWDYARYNLYKGLGELRSKYSALKTGAVRNLIVDDENNLYVFGRWNDDGTVITIASQNNKVVSLDINARKLSVADGTIFTDWFTGKQYEVDEEGMLHVEVIPGGSVLVKGTETSSFRQEYVVSTLKNADADIYLVDTDTYQLEGKGELGTSDKLVLASANLYGAGAVYAKATGDGQALLTVRQSDEKDAAAYFVILSKDKLEVKARTTEGGKLKTLCEADYTEGNAVRIVRDGKNHFAVSVAKISDSGMIAGEWEEIRNSAVSISMERVAKAGFAPMSGEITLSNVTLEALEAENHYDDFENGVIGALLTSSDSEQVALKDGTLVLSSKKGITWATTAGKDDDWTFKAKLDGTQKEGTYAGVISMSDENQWVAAGRTTIDGESVLFVGRTTDGTMLVDTWVEDTKPDSSVIIQLQRVGTTYSAVYSYDEAAWKVIDSNIFMNMSSENVGIFVAGKTEAAFDYVSFGDSVHDGVSVNTPYSEGVIDVSYSTTQRAYIYENVEILSGTWEYGTEGYYQTESSGIAQMGIKNKAYADFRLNVTLQPENSNGYAAIGFGKQEYNTEMTDGFLLKYTKDGKIELLKNGQTMAEATVKTKQDSLRIVIEVKGSNIKIYAGQRAKRVMDLKNTGYSEGYITLYTEDTAAHFMNYRFTSMDTGWNVLISCTDPQGYVTGGSNYITIKGPSGDIYGATSLVGVGVTDFITSFKVSVGGALSGDGSTPEAGVLLAASEADSRAVHGISVALMKGGILILRSDGQEIGQYELGETVRSAELMIVKKDSVCQVYVKGVASPVFEYTDSYNRGGGYQLYAVNSQSTFVNIGLEDIHNIAVEDSELYQLWTKGSLSHLKADLYRENFENISAWNSLERYYSDHGTWVIEDGTLSCIASPLWASGVTIYDRVFNEFEMEFKYRFNEMGSAWAAVLLRKQVLNDHNESTDFSVLFGSDGNVMLYDSSQKKTVANGYVSGFEIGKWHELKIVCKGDTVKVYNGGKCLIDFQDSRLEGDEGFLSFTSNGCMVSFDDVLIKPTGGR